MLPQNIYRQLQRMRQMNILIKDWVNEMIEHEDRSYSHLYVYTVNCICGNVVFRLQPIWLEKWGILYLQLRAFGEKWGLLKGGFEKIAES